MLNPEDAFCRTLYWMHEAVRNSSAMPTDGVHLAAFATYNHVPSHYDPSVIAVAAASPAFNGTMMRLATIEGQRRALRLLSDQILEKTGRQYVILAAGIEDFPYLEVPIALLRFKARLQQAPEPENPLRYLVAITPSGIVRCFNEPGPGTVVYNKWP